jgi:hypothetical protein
MPVPTEIIGVYRADGGLVGEARYVVGKLLGSAHCSLCDITHSPVRRRRQWDAMVARVPVPVQLLHLNELPTDVAEKVEVAGSPVVLVRDDEGGLTVLMDSAALDAMAGSVTAFESALVSAGLLSE